MQINRWLYINQVVSGKFHFVATCPENERKNRPEESHFIATNNWNILAFRWSLKHFLLRIPQYSGKVVEKKMENANKRNYISMLNNRKAEELLQMDRNLRDIVINAVNASWSIQASWYLC